MQNDARGLLSKLQFKRDTMNNLIVHATRLATLETSKPERIMVLTDSNPRVSIGYCENEPYGVYGYYSDVSYKMAGLGEEDSLKVTVSKPYKILMNGHIGERWYVGVPLESDLEVPVSANDTVYAGKEAKVQARKMHLSLRHRKPALGN